MNFRAQPACAPKRCTNQSLFKATPPRGRERGVAVPFTIESYKPGLLGRKLGRLSHGKNGKLTGKPQVKFLEKHLASLVCKSVLTEPDYLDRSFVEDYAAYYVRCFEPYKHVCTRLHFFKEDLDEETISKAIVADDAALLQSVYLGFIVVKPLPATIIGRTCLSPVEAPDESRHYPTNYPQPVDLYGLKLSVDTLPFQEQDREVAACASSALWTMLHNTSRLFQHAMPSPVEITKAATMHARVNGRTFPNGDGLNTLQIADAIRSVGLEPFVFAVSSMPRLAVPVEAFAEASMPTVKEADQAAHEAKMRLVLKLSALAYLRLGISLVLLGRTLDEVDGLEETRGNHAVAITGYSLSEGMPDEGYGTSGTRFTAARLDRLFVHDDQTGPFATFSFDEGNRLIANDFEATGVERRFAEPINLVVPLYHKIRIPLQQVVDVTVALDEALDGMREPLGLKDRLEWDVELISLEALRDDFARSPFDPAVKLALLTLPMPRFIWRLRGLYQDKRVFDLLLDATDLLQGPLVRHVVPYDVTLCQHIGLLLSLSENIFHDTLGPTIRAFKASQTTP